MLMTSRSLTRDINFGKEGDTHHSLRLKSEVLVGSICVPHVFWILAASYRGSGIETPTEASFSLVNSNRGKGRYCSAVFLSPVSAYCNGYDVNKGSFL